MSTPPILPGLEKGSTNEELTNLMTMFSMLAPQYATSLSGVLSILVIFLGYISLPLEMFQRVEHGERTLSPLRVFNAFIALQILWVVTSAASSLAQQIIGSSRFAGMVEAEPSSIAISPIFQAAFLAASAYHLWRISYRRRKNIIWHSMSAGISIFEAVGLLDLANYILASIRLFGRWKIPYRITRWTIYLYIEPLIGVIAAHIIYGFDPPTGVWLLLASGSLFVRNHVMQSRQRAILLNYYDSLIDSQVLSDAADQKPPKDTAGVMVIPGFAEAIAQAEELDIKGRVHKTFSSEE